MELLRGRTLREILRSRGRLPVAEALPLFIQMTNGVEAAHALNAVHRDLKPENIFVLHDNTPKILDFGIAKVIDSAFTTEKDVYSRNNAVHGAGAARGVPRDAPKRHLHVRAHAVRSVARPPSVSPRGRVADRA